MPHARARTHTTRLTRALTVFAAAALTASASAQWTQLDKLLAGDGAEDDFFGGAVALSGDLAIVGSDQNDEGGEDAGAAYVFRRDGDTWVEEAKLTAADASAGQAIGSAVAIDGDVAVVGASLDGELGETAGAAYVFRYDAGSWSQETKLLAGDAAEGDRFGISVAVDDDVILVGAYTDDDDGTNSGAVYVFRYDGDSWEQDQKLTASDAGISAFFGFSVAMSGGTAVIGATGDNDNGTDAGAAYIFTDSGSAWSQQDKLLASDGDYFDGFGFAVDISEDRAIIGAFADVNGGAFTGSAYVFRRTGASWTQEAKIMASDASHGDLFGQTVAIDGGIALVGADREDASGTDAGAIYIYRYNGSSWTQAQKLMADDATLRDNFGRAVALDGETALVGAWKDDDMGLEAGSAYLIEGARLVGEANGDRYGYALANVGDIDDDGVDELLVGAAYNDENGNLAGKAYLLSGQTGVVIRAHLGQTSGDRFGRAVSAAGDANGDGVPDYAVAAPFRQNRNGAVYVYSGADGAQLFKVSGSDGERLGWSVSGGFDVDGDGRGDVLAGAPLNRDAGNKRGKVYAFSGADGSVIDTWTGEGDKDRVGWAVAVLGDVNADGDLDFAFGAPWNDDAGGNAGKVYVRSGADRSLLYTLTGAGQGDGFGRAIANVGRANADARDDFAVGSPLYDKSGNTNAGRVDVFSGIDGSRLFATTGQSADDRYGNAIDSAGDVNGDGRDDVLVAAPWHDAGGSSRGRIYIRSGNGGGPLSVATGTANGDVYGFAVARAGDVDGDGLDDVWVGAPNHDFGGNKTGRVYQVLSEPAAASAPASTAGAGPDAEHVGPTFDVDDLISALSSLGSCDGCGADHDEDGAVTFADVMTVIAGWR